MRTQWPLQGTHSTPNNKRESCEHQSSNLRAKYIPSTPIDQPSSKQLKRSRAQDFIDSDDEEASTRRKKRRLRLDLVTSRLSRPYADPATHIIGTKAGRLGPWARQRFAGGKLLRKAALLNHMTMKRKRQPPETPIPGEGSAREAGVSMSGSQSPQKHSVKPDILPAPSAYDAFDYEDYDFDHGVQHGDDEDGSTSSEEDGYAIHSDFRLLDSSDTDPEFFDTSWSFADNEGLGFDSSRSEIKLVIENERKDEVSIAPSRHEVFPLGGARISVM